MPKRMPATPSSLKAHERAVNEYRVRQATAAAAAQGRVIAAADFKANCLALMDEVRRTGAEVVITKHGRPVAKLVPVLDTSETPFIGRGAGTIEVVGDIIAPIAPHWDEGTDL